MFAHHPIYSTGRPQNGEEETRLRETLLPFVKECEIDFLIAGHEHHQEFITAPDHDQVISGVASYVRARNKPLPGDNTQQLYKEDVLGFARMTLTPNEAKVSFIDVNGKVGYQTTRNK